MTKSFLLGVAGLLFANVSSVQAQNFIALVHKADASIKAGDVKNAYPDYKKAVETLTQPRFKNRYAKQKSYVFYRMGKVALSLGEKEQRMGNKQKGEVLLREAIQYFELCAKL